MERLVYKRWWKDGAFMGKIILTGPTGAIGMAVLQKCIEKNISILAVVNPDSQRKDRVLRLAEKHSAIHVAECNICDYSAFLPEGKYDTWIHLAWMGASGAARNDMFLQNRNVGYLLDAVEAARRAGCTCFVGAGSQAEYGAADTPLSGRAPVNPETGYGMAKLCAGQMGRKLAADYGIRFVWPRIFSVYGPYDGENTMIISGIRAMLAGLVPDFTKGEQQWDYLYSEDAAEYMLRLADQGCTEKVYCVGSGKTRKISEYIEDMRTCIGEDAKVNMGAIPYGEQQPMYLCADVGDLIEDTGFIPDRDFKEGIEKTVAWYKGEKDYEEN